MENKRADPPRVRILLGSKEKSELLDWLRDQADLRRRKGHLLYADSFEGWASLLEEENYLSDGLIELVASESEKLKRWVVRLKG